MTEQHSAQSLFDAWQRAALDLGFEVTGPCEIPLTGGWQVRASMLVPNFGAEMGMIVVSDPSRIAGLEQAMVQSGYGYSVMEPPLAEEPYDRSDYIDVLGDWGWTGSPDLAPVWLGIDG